MSSTAPESGQKVLDRHQGVFREELGTLRGTTTKIHLNPEAQPSSTAHAQYIASKNKVEYKLDRLEKNGVIKPVQFSDCAAPIVPIVKPDGIVGTINYSSQSSSQD